MQELRLSGSKRPLAGAEIPIQLRAIRNSVSSGTTADRPAEVIEWRLAEVRDGLFASIPRCPPYVRSRPANKFGQAGSLVQPIRSEVLVEIRTRTSSACRRVPVLSKIRERCVRAVAREIDSRSAAAWIPCPFDISTAKPASAAVRPNLCRSRTASGLLLVYPDSLRIRTAFAL